MKKTKIDDSVIDPPKPGLCPEIWEKVVDATGSIEIWQLKPEVKKQLVEAAGQICALAKLSLGGIVQDIHITGSITSNLYTENADIDMHFVEADDAKIKESAEQTTARLRSAFEQLSAKGIVSKTIGSHPIELYFQKNKFQDLMSVGCYSLLTGAWLVGPEIKDASYNPYDEMYIEIKNLSEQLVSDIRQTILAAYEKAVVLMKASKFGNSESTVQTAFVEMANALTKAAELYGNARAMRKRLSDPTSFEQAMQFREDKKWKVVDATFKLLDKFGYLAILKEFQTLANNSLDISVGVAIAEKVISTVKTYIGNPEKLADSEKQAESKVLLLRKMEEAVKMTFSGKMKLLSEKWKPEYDDMPYNQWGEKWMKLPNDHYVVGCIEDAAKSCQLDPADLGPKIDDLRISSVHAFSNGNLFVTVFGGANGGKIPGKCSFEQYLALAKKFINKLLAGYGQDKMFEDAWLVDWDNDCCDDVWTLRFCLALDKDQLQKFKDCTKLPPSEDYGEVIKRQEQMQESSLKSAALAAIISMLAIPGILPKTALAAQLDNVKNIQTATANSPDVKKAIAKATNGSYNGLNLTNTVNALARTIYEEAKGEGKVGQDAVASVIWNRAGGKVQNMVPTISAKLQFSCWNEYTGGWKDADYKFKIPSDVFKNSQNKEIWQYCTQLAIKLVNEEFTSTIGNFNSYLNKKKAKKEAVETWGKLCNDKIGNHWFGYQACYDGFKKEKSKQTIDLGKTYVVQKGDSLEKIAKKFNTNVASIMKLNNIKDKNKLKVGQRLKI